MCRLTMLSIRRKYMYCLDFAVHMLVLLNKKTMKQSPGCATIKDRSSTSRQSKIASAPLGNPRSQKHFSAIKDRSSTSRQSKIATALLGTIKNRSSTSTSRHNPRSQQHFSAIKDRSSTSRQSKIAAALLDTIKDRSSISRHNQRSQQHFSAKKKNKKKIIIIKRETTNRGHLSRQRTFLSR